jgi:hypothetical protein
MHFPSRVKTKPQLSVLRNRSANIFKVITFRGCGSETPERTRQPIYETVTEDAQRARADAHEQLQGNVTRQTPTNPDFCKRPLLTREDSILLHKLQHVSRSKTVRLLLLISSCSLFGLSGGTCQIDLQRRDFFDQQT